MSLVFSGFVVDPESYRLLRDGHEVALEPRTFDLLLYLIKHCDRVVPKQELLEQVWGAKVLSEGVLSNAIAKLRRAIGQGPDAKQPIETVHGRGYCFRAQSQQVVAHPERDPPLPRTASLDPFVGRQAVMQVLLQRLGQDYRGSENLVVLSGEAGVGKTRITRELSALARERGVGVWVGAAYEGGGAPPYWPWLQILRAAHEELGDAAWRRHLPAGAWAIAQLMPELGLPSRALTFEAEIARFQLFNEVTHFIKSASGTGPLLLVMDDLQWADPGTIELVAFAARGLQQLPVMLLATLRTGELPADRDTPSAMERLGRIATPLGLQGLSADEVGELALAITGRDAIEPELTRALHSRTQGNALFVRQALDLITQRGDWSFVAEEMSALDLPPAIRHVIRRRLSGLPEAARRALAAAAVIGTTFEVHILAAILDMTAEIVLDDLEPAVRIGIVEQSSSRPDSFSFAHVLAKDSLYEELGIRRRGELHGRIARALSQRHERARSRHLGEIANHYLRALPFDTECAVDACRKAATAAQEASGFEAAAQLLTRAIQKLDAERVDDPIRFRLLLELGEHHFYAGRIDSAWSAFRDAADTIRPAGPVELLAEVAPRLVDCLELGAGDARVARTIVEQALSALPSHAPALRAGLLAQRAELAVELPVDERFELLDRAAVLAEQSGVSAAILEVAHSRAILRDPTRLRENAQAADRFFALAERYSEAAEGMRYRSLRRFGAFLTRYLCALTACDVAAADAALEQCREIANFSHVRAVRFAVELMRAGRALGDGQLTLLEQILNGFGPLGGSQQDTASVLREPTHRAGDMQSRLESAAWSSYLFALLRARGNLAALSDLHLDGTLIAHHAASRHGTYVVIGSAHRYALTDQLDRARTLLVQIPESAMARMPAQYGDFGALCALVEICCAQNDRANAEQLYAKLSPYSAFNAVGPTFEYRGSIAHYLGLLAKLLGRQSHATEHFQQAIAVNRQLGMPLQVAATEHELQPR